MGSGILTEIGKEEIYGSVSPPLENNARYNISFREEEIECLKDVLATLYEVDYDPEVGKLLNKVEETKGIFGCGFWDSPKVGLTDLNWDFVNLDPVHEFGGPTFIPETGDPCGCLNALGKDFEFGPIKPNREEARGADGHIPAGLVLTPEVLAGFSRLRGATNQVLVLEPEVYPITYKSPEDRETYWSGEPPCSGLIPDEIFSQILLNDFKKQPKLSFREACISRENSKLTQISASTAIVLSALVGFVVGTLATLLALCVS